jgi:opacity protein-like surface antigen
MLRQIPIGEVLLGAWRSSLAGVCLLCLATNSVHAQEPGGSGELPIASLEVEQYFTDNVFFSRPLFDQERLHDWVTVVRPRLGYKHTFKDGSINLGASAAIGLYSTYTSENYVDLDLSASGQYRFDPLTTAVWGLGLTRGHEPRSSIEPSDQIGTEPTTYWQTNAYAAIARRLENGRVQFGVTYDGYDFSDVGTVLPPFVVNQDDRDRDIFTVGGRYTRDVGDGQSLFAENIVDLRKYRTNFDDSGFTRDSYGLRSTAGFQRTLGENARIELFGGVLYHDFSDTRFDTIVAPDFGGKYSWEANGTSVVADIQRTLEETTLADVSSYLRTTARVQLRQDVTDDLRIYGGLAYADLDFQGNGRRDAVTNVWIGARKYLTPYFYAGAEASFEELDSSDPTNDYTETRIMARLGVDSQRAFERKDSPHKSADTSSGFYVGAGAELASLGTMLDGPRQSTNGSLTADFGAFGAGGYALAGWGTDINSTYLGVEAELGVSDAQWNHSRLPGGRVFSVSGKNSLGLSLLAGHRLASGTLLYGRAGVRSSDFTTDYATANATASFSNRLTGLEYGVGVRTPVSDRLALTLEYTQTRYPDYTAKAGMGTPDRFANVESRARTALTYHFGGIPGAAQQMTQPTDFSGWYWGVQGGFGAMNSLTRGSREPEGTPPVDSVLTADFGDTGFAAGGVAGYNHQFNRFVFGAEFEAEYDGMSWNHERAPSGRTFSLRNDFSAGVSGRAGYVLDGGAMLYARAGVVGSHFEHKFSTPGVTVAEDAWHGGLRYGGGIEVPLTGTSRVRFDYTFTDYGTLKLATPPGLETYETNESLFRIGYLKRF